MATRECIPHRFSTLRILLGRCLASERCEWCDWLEPVPFGKSLAGGAPLRSAVPSSARAWPQDLLIASLGLLGAA